ncbi:hypothetical protein [Tenacibaculum sp. SDUM215027]|uniref:hypothetical protein n=1 Tax=Tenacibaculum sp. SDUM215027 TaxID=3422596 RepID=UPI003D322B89
MLEQLFLKYLSKKGKIFYFIGQIILFTIWAIIVFKVLNHSLNRGENLFFIGLISIWVVWTGISLLFFRKKDSNNIISE